jgi:hypothetical protein
MGEREKFWNLLSSVLASLVVRNVITQVPSNNTSSNTSSALFLVATTRVATIQEFQKHKKSVTFNIKQQGIEFF